MPHVCGLDPAADWLAISASGHMAHAPETGHGIAEETIGARRLATLSEAGRINLGD